MQGQRETNASNTSLIDDIYDDIMLNEEKRKKTYNIKDYSIKRRGRTTERTWYF